MSEFDVPEAVVSLLTRDVAHEIAAVYQDHAVYPDEFTVDRPEDDRRIFNGWPGPVLLIMIENQGVCEWGVPLDRGVDPPVVVSHEPKTVVYAPNIAHFIAVRRWDHVCLHREPHLWAQADELDDEALTYLRDRFEEVLPTRGMPTPVQYRFQDGTSTVMLWSSEVGCEWRISSSDLGALERLTADLLNFSNLREELWCGDPDGEALLDRLKAR